MRRPNMPAYAQPAEPTPRQRFALMGWIAATLISLGFWLLIILSVALVINVVSGGLVLIIVGRHL